MIEEIKEVSRLILPKYVQCHSYSECVDYPVDDLIFTNSEEKNVALVCIFFIPFFQFEGHLFFEVYVESEENASWNHKKEKRKTISTAKAKRKIN